MNQFSFLILKSILQRTLLNQEHSDLWQYLIQGSGDHWHVTGEFHYLVGQSGERLQGKILWRVNLSDIGINSSCAGGSLVLMLVQPFSYSLTVASSLNHSLACWLAQTAGWPWPLHYLTQCVIISVQLCYIRFDHKAVLYLDTDGHVSCQCVLCVSYLHLRKCIRYINSGNECHYSHNLFFHDLTYWMILTRLALVSLV